MSPDLQASRDADAERLVGAELATNDVTNPDAQAALETEYRQRFGKKPPQVPRGFVPLGNSGFTPLASNDWQLSPARAILLNNPLAAAGEVALNLGSQAVGLPVAGIAGLGAIATHALGLTSTEPGDVVRNVGEAMTYAPRGEYGKAAAGLVAIPFEKLAEVGKVVGDKVAIDEGIDETLGQPVNVFLRHAVLQSGQRGSGSQVSSRLQRSPTDSQFEHRIATQGVRVVAIGVPAGGLENPLPKQVGQGVINVRSVALVVNRTHQAGYQADLQVGAAQQPVKGMSKKPKPIRFTDWSPLDSVIGI